MNAKNTITMHPVQSLSINLTIVRYHSGFEEGKQCISDFFFFWGGRKKRNAG